MPDPLDGGQRRRQCLSTDRPSPPFPAYRPPPNLPQRPRHLRAWPRRWRCLRWRHRRQSRRDERLVARHVHSDEGDPLIRERRDPFGRPAPAAEDALVVGAGHFTLRQLTTAVSRSWSAATSAVSSGDPPIDLTKSRPRSFSGMRFSAISSLIWETSVVRSSSSCGKRRAACCSAVSGCGTVTRFASICSFVRSALYMPDVETWTSVISSKSCVKMSLAAVTLSTAATRLRLLAILRTVFSVSAKSSFATRPVICPVIAGSSAANSCPHPPALAKQYQPGASCGLPRGGNFDLLICSAPHFGQARLAWR